MAIVWGFAAAIGFGVSDFIAREAGQREGSLKTLLYLYLIGTPVVAAFAFASESAPWQRIFSPAGLAAALISLESTVGAVLLYRALVKGPLLIVSPIVSSFAAVTTVLSLLSGERPATAQLVGIVVTLAGVALAAATTPEGSSPETQVVSGRGTPAWISSGVAAAIGAALLFGVAVWLLRFVIPALGSLTTVLVQRASSLTFLAAFYLASRRSFELRSVSSLKWLLPIGVIDTASNWFVNLGLLAGLTSIVSVIVSLFSVVTVLLGYFILKERITRVQQMGIVVTLAGVALVSS